MDDLVDEHEEQLRSESHVAMDTGPDPPKHLLHDNCHFGARLTFKSLYKQIYKQIQNTFVSNKPNKTITPPPKNRYLSEVDVKCKEG